MIEGRSLQMFLVVAGVITVTLLCPPFGLLAIAGLTVAWVIRSNRRRKARAAERAARRQVYWDEGRIARRYYS